jgi:shikimate dehydrogenase
MNKNTINGNTTVLAVFGDPISHSLSPLMHNAAFSALGWDCVYIPCRVETSQLQNAVRSIRALNWKGVNITIPHKQAVMNELDQIIGDAEKSGSVNTIINRDHRLIGASTDGVGFLRSLHEEGHFDVKGKRVLLFGAGGASRAVLYSLVSAGIAVLTVVNRDLEKANGLRLQVLQKTGFTVNVVNLADISKIDWDSFDLLINSTSVGRQDDQSLIPDIYLQPKHFVYDMNYKKGDTKLYRDAQQLGCQALSGLSMLLYQGVESFRLWFDSDPPIDIMRSTLYQYYQ